MKKSLEIVRALLIVILMISITLFSAFVPSLTMKETSVPLSTTQESIGHFRNTTGTETDPVGNKTEAVPPPVEALNSTDAFDGPYFDVTPVAVHITTAGQTFLVTIALHDITLENVPAGIGGVEVHMTWNTSLVEPVNFTDYLGVSGTGALMGPTLSALDGFYNSNGQECNRLLAQATEFAVAEASTAGPWWSANSTGTVAVIAFEVTSSPTTTPTTCFLTITSSDLGDANADEVPHNLMKPLIRNISNNLLDNGIVSVNCTVPDADHCVLSYMYNYEGYASGWINESMTKEGNSYTASFDTSFVSSETNFTYRITAYDSYGHSTESTESFETTPKILGVSDNLQEGCIPNGTVTVTADVKFANQCTLSYMYDDSGTTSDWTDEPMIRDGENYTGTINADIIPGNTDATPPTIVEYKVVAYDKFGNSIESALSGFVKCKEGKTFLSIYSIYPNEEGIIGITAIAGGYDRCVISYQINYTIYSDWNSSDWNWSDWTYSDGYNGTTTDIIGNWTNATMTKGRIMYTTTIDYWLGAFQDAGFWKVSIQFRVTAYDSFGNSTQTAICFVKYNSSDFWE